MIDPHFVLLGAALGMVGSIRYAWLTVRGRTQPNRVTWFLWATAPLIGFFAALDEGVGLPAVLSLSAGLGPVVVFTASFVNRSSVWKVSRFDIGCGMVSVAALVVWLSLDNPTLAVVFAVLADFIGGVPTIVKAWRAPETEDTSPFVFFTVNGVITLFTIDRWDVATWAFPGYIAVLGAALTLIIAVRGRRASARPAPPPRTSASPS